VAADVGGVVDACSSVGAALVVAAVGSGVTDDAGDAGAGAERGAVDVATRRPSRPAAPCVPPPHAAPRITVTAAMSATVRAFLVTLVTSAAGYRFEDTPSAPGGPGVAPSG
jgi:hypothetical protein